MTRPFRYFRGELNGIFLQTLLASSNQVVDKEIDELAFQASRVWPTVVGDGQVAMRDEEVYIIGSYLSAFVGAVPGVVGPANVIQYTTEFRSTENILRTERGLLNTGANQFEFQNVEVDDPLGDIVDNATPGLRSSLIPEGQPIIGYIPRSAVAYNEIGAIIISEVLLDPPIGEPYVPYYGEEFLVLPDIGTPDPINMLAAPFAGYVEVLQKIRRDGPSVVLLCELTQALVGGFVTDLELQFQADYIFLQHTVLGVDSVDAYLKLVLWRLIVRNRFPNVLLL